MRVVVVGAGFAGIGAAVKLGEAGYRDVAVLERAGSVGGTWRDNTYPGCACDIPSHLYSFSFAPNPDWTRSFSPQPEIWRYLEEVCERFDVRRWLRCGVELTEARWDEAGRCWLLSTSDGPLTADVLVSAAGPLSEPALPAVPGLDQFGGPVFHSARWDHGVDLAGARVAVIGTGASAVQFVPRIQPTVARLHVFQRTAPWILPRRDRPIPAGRRRLFRAAPTAQQLARAAIYVSREALVVGFVAAPAALRAVEALARRHLAARTRAQLDRVHDRVPASLPGGRAAHHGRPRAGQRRADRGRAAALERRPAPADAAHRVDHRRLRELVPGRPGPGADPCGPAPPCGSAGSPAGSTWPSTTSRPPRAPGRGHTVGSPT
jgi:cation diffusion facilitator CzcD-associated flavoprotein CzcO